MTTPGTHSVLGNSEYGAVDMGEAAGGADAPAKLEWENWGEILLDRRPHDLGVDEVVKIIRWLHPHLVECSPVHVVR